MKPYGEIKNGEQLFPVSCTRRALVLGSFKAKPLDVLFHSEIQAADGGRGRVH